jgi:hypothetical protein
MAVVLVCAVALCAAVLTGFTHWTRVDRDFKKESREVVRVATGMAEAMASFTPSAPTGSIDRAAATRAAGVEALGPSVASVAVILRVTQNAPGQPPSQAAPAVRVALAKRGDSWLVSDVTPINPR